MVTRRALCDTPQSWIFPHYSSFNGIRAVAMLAVFVIHYGQITFAWQRNYPPLWAGVDLFFVLSGFLITGILVDSLEDQHYFRNFMGRRALRIFPLIYGIALALFLLRPVLHLGASRYLPTTFFYISNWFGKSIQTGRIYNPTLVWVPALHAYLCFGHFWSLCVEEQYYLAWPLVVYLVRSRRTLLKLCVAGSAAVLALRTFYYLHATPADLQTHLLYYSTWSRCDALLIGSAVALWLREVRLTQTTLHLIGRWLVFGSLALLAVGFAFCGMRYVCNENHPVFATYGYTVNALCAAGLLLLALDKESRVSGLLRTRWLAALGEISYGMYVFHMVPLHVLGRFSDLHLRPHHLQLLAFPLGFAYTWAMATLSFRFYEKPFLKLKSWFMPMYSRPVPVLPVSAAQISLHADAAA